MPTLEPIKLLTPPRPAPHGVCNRASKSWMVYGASWMLKYLSEERTEGGTPGCSLPISKMANGLLLLFVVSGWVETDKSWKAR
jgi:hypothetical protein